MVRLPRDPLISVVQGPPGGPQLNDSLEPNGRLHCGYIGHLFTHTTLRVHSVPIYHLAEDPLDAHRDPQGSPDHFDFLNNV